MCCPSARAQFACVGMDIGKRKLFFIAKWQEKIDFSPMWVEHFTTYCFCTRDVASAIGREGLGDSFELQIRYMLAKFVFVSLKYKGWVGLSEHAIHEKAEPYKYAVREHWKRLKRSDTQLKSTIKPFVKKKWCDLAYFFSQVRTKKVLKTFA